jgi:hypothetical protein
MRPFGHTEAREGRDAHLNPLDQRLQAAWEEFLSAEMWRDPAIHLRSVARALLMDIRPPKAAIERFILRTISDDHVINLALTDMLNAAFSLLPERRIVYRLDTPTLHHIGYGLEKDLIITGTLGYGTGSEMIGSLVNYGTLGNDAGYCMIGSFINHGTVGLDPGYQFIGTVQDDGMCGSFPFVSMIGRHTGGGTRTWRRFNGSKRAFLKDIKNPDHLPYDTLRMRLKSMYEDFA